MRHPHITIGRIFCLAMATMLVACEQKQDTESRELNRRLDRLAEENRVLKDRVRSLERPSQDAPRSGRSPSLSQGQKPSPPKPAEPTVLMITPNYSTGYTAVLATLIHQCGARAVHIKRTTPTSKQLESATAVVAEIKSTGRDDIREGADIAAGLYKYAQNGGTVLFIHYQSSTGRGFPENLRDLYQLSIRKTENAIFPGKKTVPGEQLCALWRGLKVYPKYDDNLVITALGNPSQSIMGSGVVGSNGGSRRYPLVVMKCGSGIVASGSEFFRDLFLRDDSIDFADNEEAAKRLIRWLLQSRNTSLYQPGEPESLGMQPTRVAESNRQSSSVVDPLLDAAIRSVDGDPDSDAARDAKEITKKAFDPRATSSELQETIRNAAKRTGK